MNRRLSWWLAGLCVIAITSCTAEHEPSTPSLTKRGNATATRPTPSSHGAPDFLLSQQFDLGGTGGTRFGCSEDLKDRPTDRPLVWLTSSEDENVRAILNTESLLCLYGFPKNKPITVTVTAGSRAYTTPIRPVSEFSTDGGGGDLFNGRPIEVQDLGDGVLQSGFLWFFPPEPAREAIALDGRLRLAASSGDLRTANEVPLSWEEGAGATEAEWKRHQIAVYGYPPGTRVPIGLYRVQNDQEDTGDELAVLERPVGEVVMPESRIAVFTIPQDVFRIISVEPEWGEDYYCLSVPGAEMRQPPTCVS
ncbi:hypothetical protein ACGFYQ_38135 [Streptomyces sp. NPDC048258]|uniref:hypothetical protein n=1 Tax=Streptomyces sp. NPDC048258 TaxID=3365527 RepID=UPI00370F7E9F